MKKGYFVAVIAAAMTVGSAMTSLPGGSQTRTAGGGRMRMGVTLQTDGSGLTGMVMEFPRVITLGQMDICMQMPLRRMDIQ